MLLVHFPLIILDIFHQVHMWFAQFTAQHLQLLPNRSHLHSLLFPYFSSVSVQTALETIHHTHSQSDVKSGVHPDGRRSCYDNRLSDPRSVTSVMWSECELSITLCCTSGQTVSTHSEESGLEILAWGLDWCVGPFIRFHMSDCHIMCWCWAFLTEPHMKHNVSLTNCLCNCFIKALKTFLITPWGRYFQRR